MVDCVNSTRTKPLFLQTFIEKSLLKIFNNPYWSRIWIIQEIMFAATLIVQCGRKRVKWKHVVKFLEMCEFRSKARMELLHGPQKISGGRSGGRSGLRGAKSILESSATKIIRHKIDFDSDEQGAGSAFSLFSLVHQFQSFRASKFQDKVFALCGLVRQGRAIEIDYGLSKLELFGKLELLNYKYAWNWSRTQTVSRVLEMSVPESVEFSLRLQHRDAGCKLQDSACHFLATINLSESCLKCPKHGLSRMPSWARGDIRYSLVNNAFDNQSIEHPADLIEAIENNLTIVF
jgi:hypothetical protein